ncbi:hypothetical protein [Fructobacillus fructosus]|uniref:hypothetical protein n=1 Tax=Fructobacillus fructosus TaxID=1631 RepID=UPI0030C7D9BA
MIDLADEIDRYFKACISGKIDALIKCRIKKLEEDTGGADENYGGGRIQNVNVAKNGIENRIIRKSDDWNVAQWKKDLWNVNQFMLTLTPHEQQLLQMRYRRKPYSWDKVAKELYKSKRQCYNDLKRIKQEFSEGAYWDPSFLWKTL